MFIAKVFSFFSFCLLAGCGDSVSQIENTKLPLQTEKTELSLSMKRSHCYGTCPVYELDIRPDGKVLFNGIDFTETKGKIEGVINKEKINEIIAEIDKANFFLKESYTEDSGNCPSIATDSPTVTISAKLNDREKTITHYLGCFEEYDLTKGNSSNLRTANDLSLRIYPQQLYRLENKIDEITGTKRWIGER